MKFKKIIPLLTIASTIVMGNLIFGQCVYAADASNKITSTSIVQSQTKIGPDTVITKENTIDVLKYIGIDPSSFIPTNDIDQNVKRLTTVGELQKAIVDAKKPAKVATVNKIAANKTSSTSSMGIDSVSKNKSGSLGLCSTTKVGDSYILTISCSGQYDSYYRQWTSVSGLGASVDTAGTTIYIYKIAPGADLSATCGPTEIEVDSYVTINKYVAIPNGITFVGYQGVQGTDTYDAIDYYSKMK